MEEVLYREVSRAARSVSDNWPGVIDSDDVEQEIWLHLLERSSYLEKVRVMSHDERVTVFLGIGHQVASRYRADLALFTGNVRYGADEVRRLLKAGALLSALEDLQNGSQSVTEALDLREGFQALREKSDVYSDAIESEFIHEDYDKSAATSRRRLGEAVRRLTELMNNVNRRRYDAYTNGVSEE